MALLGVQKEKVLDLKCGDCAATAIGVYPGGISGVLIEIRDSKTALATIMKASEARELAKMLVQQATFLEEGL